MTWSAVGKIATYIALLIVLTAVAVIARRAWGWDLDFINGWIMAGAYIALSRGERRRAASTD